VPYLRYVRTVSLVIVISIFASTGEAVVANTCRHEKQQDHEEVVHYLMMEEEEKEEEEEIGVARNRSSSLSQWSPY
jgi:hypothetical protein